MPIYRRGGSGGDSGIPEIAAGDSLKVVRVKLDESGLELATPTTGGADEAAVLAIAFATGY